MDHEKLTDNIIWVVGSYLFVASVSGCITGYTDLCVYKKVCF